MISPVQMFVNFIFRREYLTLEKFKEHLGLVLKETQTRSCPLWGAGNNHKVACFPVGTQ